MAAAWSNEVPDVAMASLPLSENSFGDPAARLIAEHIGVLRVSGLQAAYARA